MRSENSKSQFDTQLSDVSLAAHTKKVTSHDIRFSICSLGVLEIIFWKPLIFMTFAVHPTAKDFIIRWSALA